MCEKVGKNSSWMDTKAHKYNETHFAYTGNLTLNLEQNNLWIRATMQSKPKGSNKWNSILSVRMKLCLAIERYIKKIVTEMFLNAGFKYTCPVPKGIYNVKDYIIDLDQIFNVPVLPYGFSKTQLMVFSMKRNRNVMETCLQVAFEIVPK
ncbi:chemosensory protein A 87a isoform X2 [Lycorma delicatula]